MITKTVPRIHIAERGGKTDKEKKSLTSGCGLEVAGIGWISRVRVDSRE